MLLCLYKIEVIVNNIYMIIAAKDNIEFTIDNELNILTDNPIIRAIASNAIEYANFSYSVADGDFFNFLANQLKLLGCKIKDVQFESKKEQDINIIY